MDTRPASTTVPTRDTDAFYQELERNHLVALWSVNKSLLPKEPRSRCVPHLWRWETDAAARPAGRRGGAA